MIKVIHIQDEQHLKQAFEIRQQVFVVEQQVPKELEYDEFEEIARHFLAFVKEIPCGTARWRFTEKGVKLERFAVLESHRKMGVGLALVQAVIDDVKQHSAYQGQILYLHAQITAMPLYAKAGFEKVGEEFMEADIRHYKMVLAPVHSSNYSAPHQAL